MKRKMMNKVRPLIEVIEELTVSGTWTVPPGCRSVDVFLCGGGAGGGGGVSGDSPGGSGGGGGYTKVIYKIAVTPGTSISYTIGKGGTGGGDRKFFRERWHRWLYPIFVIILPCKWRRRWL